MRNNCMHRIGLAGAMALMAVSLTGCVGYRLGSMLPKDIVSVYIPTFVNNTDEPLIEIDATRAAIEEFQKDGSMKIARSADDATAILKVTLTRYELTPISYDFTKKTAANEYRLKVYATILMTRKATNQVLVESPSISGETTFPLSGDFTTTKRLNMPQAAQDLAQNIVSAVVEAW